MKKLATLILVSISFDLVFGQCNCSDALTQDLVSMNLSKEASLHYLNTINESTFQKAKSKGGLDVVIPIVDVPLGASFEEFSEWRNNKFKLENFDKKEAESQSYFKQSTSTEGYKSYNNCVELCLANPGLFATIISISKDHVELEVFYRASPNGGTLSPISITSSLTNGKEVLSPGEPGL